MGAEPDPENDGLRPDDELHADKATRGGRKRRVSVGTLVCFFVAISYVGFFVYLRDGDNAISEANPKEVDQQNEREKRLSDQKSGKQTLTDGPRQASTKALVPIADASNVTAAKDQGSLLDCGGSGLSRVTTLERTSDGRYALSGERSRESGVRDPETGHLTLAVDLQLWDCKSGDLLQRLLVPAKGSLVRIMFMPDPQRALVVTSGEVHLWNLNTEFSIRTVGRGTNIMSADISPDGRSVVALDQDNRKNNRGVHFWETDSGKELWTSTLDVNAFSRVAFDPSGRFVWSFQGSHEPTLSQWSVSTGEELRKIKCRPAESGSPDRKNEWVRTYRPVGPALFSPSRKYVLFPIKQRTGRHPRRPVRVIRTQDGKDLKFTADKEKVVGFLHDDSILLTARKRMPHGRDIVESLIRRDPASGTELSTVTSQFGWIRLLAEQNAFSGDVLFCPQEDGSAIRLVDINTGKQIRCLSFDESEWKDRQQHRFTPEGIDQIKVRYIWIIFPLDHRIVCWDVVEQKEIRFLGGHSHRVRRFALSHNGRYATSVDKHGTVILWNMARGVVIERFTALAPHTQAIAVSDDGAMLAFTNGDGHSILFDMQERTEIRRFTLWNGGMTSVAFSRDGMQLATGCENGTLQLWNTDTGEPTISFKGFHGKGRSEIKFSESGTQIVTVRIKGDRISRMQGRSLDAFQMWDTDQKREVLPKKGWRSQVQRIIEREYPDSAKPGSDGTQDWFTHMYIHYVSFNRIIAGGRIKAGAGTGTHRHIGILHRRSGGGGGRRTIRFSR
jgi:WD40 repeat protein